MAEGKYTIAMTVVLTAQDMGEVSDISGKLGEYLRLLCYDRDGRVERTITGCDGRRGATVDDVVPAKIVTAEDILRQDEEVTP